MLSIILMFFLFSGSCLASMAAWLTDLGPQLVIQDSASEALIYNRCSINLDSNLTAASNDSLVLQTNPAPKIGTSLAGVGWFDAVTTWASLHWDPLALELDSNLIQQACLWYQDAEYRLVYARYECNLTSNEFELHESEILSDSTKAAVPSNVTLHEDTGIAAVLLGAEEGIRVYFHDDEKFLHELSFQNPTGWRYRSQVSSEPAESLDIAAAAAWNGDVTVVQPGSSSFNVFTLLNGYDTSSWTFSSFPQDGQVSLPSWPGNSTSLAFTIDGFYSHSLFYLGSDSMMRQLISTVDDSTLWTEQPNQLESVWPEANSPSAHLALASLRGTSPVRLYYHAEDQELSESAYDGNSWSQARSLKGFDILPSSADEAPSPPSPSDVKPTTPASTPATSEEQDNSGLSIPERAAIGASIGTVLLACLVAAIVFSFRRRRSSIRSESRASRHSRPVSRNGDFAHVRPYSEFGTLRWNDGGVDEETESVRSRGKRAFTL